MNGHVHPVNARISGTIAEVLVEDNQVVPKGAVLVKLDPRDYQVSLQQAQAALKQARHQANVARANIGVIATTAQGQTTTAQGDIDAAAASVSTAEGSLAEAQAGVPAAKAQLAQVNANLVKARLDYQRYTQLYQTGAASVSNWIRQGRIMRRFWHNTRPSTNRDGKHRRGLCRHRRV